MKTLTLLLFSLLTLNVMAIKNLPHDWTIVSSNYDSTISKGFSVINFIVYNASNMQPLKNVQVS